MENLEKLGNFLSQGKVRENRQSQGKVRRIMILSASITNSNFTSESTQNAHICIEFFKNILRGSHSASPLLGMDTPDPTPLTASQLDLGTTRLGSKSSVSRSFIPDRTVKVKEKSGNFIWPGESPIIGLQPTAVGSTSATLTPLHQSYS